MNERREEAEEDELLRSLIGAIRALERYIQRKRERKSSKLETTRDSGIAPKAAPETR